MRAMATLKAEDMMALGRLEDAKDALHGIIPTTSHSMSERSSILRAHSCHARLCLMKFDFAQAKSHVTAFFQLLSQSSKSNPGIRTWDDNIPDMVCYYAEILRLDGDTEFACQMLQFWQQQNDVSPLDAFKIGITTQECSKDPTITKRDRDQLSRLRELAPLLDHNEYEVQIPLLRWIELAASTDMNDGPQP